MKWASALSLHPSADEAAQEGVHLIQERLGDGLEPDLVTLFVSAHHREAWHSIAATVASHFPNATIIGCSGAGVIGAGQEEEREPAVSLTAGSLPQVEAVGFYLPPDGLPSPDAPPEAWAERLGIRPEAVPHFLLLVEPFSTSAEALLEGLDFAFPESVKLGGLASGAYDPGDHALFLNGRIYRSGTVGVALHGNIVVDTVVAQGCRPVGQPMRITKAQGNILIATDDEPPLLALQRLFQSLPPHDQALVQRDLFVGIAMDPLQEEVKHGGFLIRNILGMDSEQGILAIGASLQEGQLVQFHIRDAYTSREDLDYSLHSYVDQGGGSTPVGALLFSCTGRGRGLYGQPNHDTALFEHTVGSLPLGGFFCNGEIGPVSGTTYLHGYTSSFALFRPRTGPD